MSAAHVPIDDLMGPRERERSERRSTARGAWTFLLLRAVCVALLSWLAASLLWTVGPMALGLSPTLVMSGSMAPKIDTGDVVLTAPVTADGPSRLRPGTVIVAENPAQPGTDLLHRVTKLDDDSVRTKGDANPSEDSTPIAREDVDGVGRLLVPFVGRAVVWAVEGQLVWVAVAGAALVALVAAATTRTSSGLALGTVVTALALVGATVLGSHGVSAAWTSQETRAPSPARAWEYPAQQAMWVGDNGAGQAGGGDIVASRRPAQVTTPVFNGWSTGTTSTSLTAQGNQSCGIYVGNLYCVGQQYLESVFPLPNTDRRSPKNVYQQVASTSDWSTVTSGGTFTCGTDSNNKLWCFGQNGSGQLGQSDTAWRISPTQIGTDNWKMVSAGDAFVCGARGGTNGLWCWGKNDVTQLGDGTTTNQTAPKQIATGNWSQVSAGKTHACAFLNSNALSCWGANGSGQLGTSDNAPKTTPTSVTGGTSVTKVATGDNHTCAIRSNALSCTGLNSSGQLGTGNTTNRNSLGAVSGGGTWLNVSAGGDTTCGVKLGFTLWCWGANTWGQVGDGTTTARSAPVSVAPGLAISDVEVGEDHACATTTSGMRYCWGKNHVGQLGLGRIDVPQSADPLPMSGNSSAGWVAMSGGALHTCGTRSDRTLWCWGRNDDGELGQNDTTDRGTPTQVGSTGWLRVSAGAHHTCATKSDTTLWCWGQGGNGRLGNGSASGQTAPTQALGTGWSSVSAGFATTCATKTDYTLWCWGLDEDGETGTGTVGATDLLAPTQVAGTGWSSVTMNGYHGCATKLDRTLWCWGYNASGAVGDSSTTNRRAPVQVAGTTWDRVWGGGWATCATKTDATLWCWGRNTDGQLGQGNTTNRSSPQRVSTWTDVTSVAAGLDHACAVRSTGEVYCWGGNGSGQLGLGTLAGYADVLSPTLSSPAAQGTRVYEGETTTYIVSPSVSREAEDALLTNCTPVIEASASGGRDVGYMGTTSTIDFDDIVVPAAGTYKLRVFYGATGGGSNYTATVNSGSAQTLTFTANTGGLLAHRPGQTIVINVTLTSGTNRIVIRKTNNTTPNLAIDRITVSQT